MSGSAPRDRHRRQPGCGLPGRCSLFVPALVVGAWTAAGASHGGSAEGEMTPFLLAIAAILVAAKIGGELVERLNQPAVLGELLFGIVLGNIGLTGFELFDALKTAPFLAIAAEVFAGVGATAMVAGAPVFDGETFAAIVATVMVTTLATPPLLRAAFPRRAGDRAEAPEAAG